MHFRVAQRPPNSQRLSSTNTCGGVGGVCNHQCNNNQYQIMPTTTTSTSWSSMSNSNSASNNVSNPNVMAPSPPTSLSNIIPPLAPSPVGLGSNTVAGEDSDYSDFDTQQPSTSNSRSRQKQFLKNFKQLPQEEVVLQRKFSICVNTHKHLYNSTLIVP